MATARRKAPERQPCPARPDGGSPGPSMQSPAESHGPTREAVRAALLDYFQTPGKYQVGQRYPRLLFAGLREVLQIAVGREADAGAEPPKVREAARFFIRTA